MLLFKINYIIMNNLVEIFWHVIQRHYRIYDKSPRRCN